MKKPKFKQSNSRGLYATDRRKKPTVDDVSDTRMTAKALKEKELGNAAFKSGDFATAVGHYTSAIIEDRNEATFYLNRAAAYLKLGKDADAENDCSKALALKDNNAKALYRRGQARIGLGKLQEAQQDLRLAAKFEPANDSVKQELQRVASLIDKGKNKVVAQDVPPYRRRIPIKIVDAPGASASPPPDASETKLEPISSRPLTSEPRATPTPSSFKEAKQAREQKKEAKPSRVGGGIFRANGQSTIFKRDPPAPVVKPSGPSQPSNGPLPNVKPSVATLFDLNRAWDSANTVDQRFDLITSIEPTRYKSIFQMSLEPTLLSSIMETYAQKAETGDRATVEVIAQSMNAFTQVPRFDTLLMFLSKKEKETARQVVQKVSSSVAIDDRWKKVL